MKPASEATAFFWKIANAMLGEAGVTKSTMMGFPCLRQDGEFFACADHRTGDLIVKLPTGRVETMIQSGAGQAFSPAGRKFREWVLVVGRDTRQWRKLLREARAFVAGA